MTIGIALNDAKLYAYDINDIPKITGVDIKAGVNITTNNKTRKPNISVKIGETSGHFIDDDCDTASSFDIENKEEK